MSVNIPCTIRTQISYHTWQFAAAAFTDALPWVAPQLNTPTTPPALQN